MRGSGAKSVMTGRERNRALLARQLLLERASLRPLAAVERLVGMQAQTPRSPYTALWSRLVDFDPMTLSHAVSTRRAVRIALMRSTIHLVSARDALRLRPLMAPILERELTTPVWRTALDGLDLADVAARARVLLEEKPQTPKQLGEALMQSWPGRQPRALAHAARCLLPLVQLPPRGTWDGSGATTLTTAEHWLGRPIDATPDWNAVALRYLAAFGPATAADLVVWCRVTGLGEVISRLRPQLRVLHDEDGRELFDLPRAPRPPATTAAPPRFLPDFDNVLLSHADRNHVFADAHRRAIQTTNGVLPGSVLVDGSVAAAWSVERDGDTARLVIRRLDLPDTARPEVRDEGLGLLTLLAPDARRTEVTFSG
jgi:hypothetical protein